MSKENKKERINVRIDEDLENDMEYIKEQIRQKTLIELNDSELVRSAIKNYKKILEKS